jgi:hypothetical protein
MRETCRSNKISSSLKLILSSFVSSPKKSEFSSSSSSDFSILFNKNYVWLSQKMNRLKLIDFFWWGGGSLVCLNVALQIENSKVDFKNFLPPSAVFSLDCSHQFS